MRRKKAAVRRCLALLLCLALSFGLCGCWSQRELDTLAIVLGTAVDMGGEPDTITLTAQIVKPAEIKGSASPDGGGGGSSKPYANMQNTGPSMLTLLRDLTRMTNRRLYFSHNQVFILSEEMARLALADGLDPFTRNHETRLNVYIVIARGNAAEILDEEPGLEKIPAMHIADMLEHQDATSETAVTTLRDFSIAMLSKTTAPVAPMIELVETLDGQKRARLRGTAIFKRGKMIGEFDTRETRGLLLITGKAQGGVMTVGTRWGQVVLEIVSAKSALKSVKTPDGRIKMELRVNIDGFVEGNETPEDMAKEENIAMLKGLAEEELRADIAGALEKARSLSADAFAFGELIRRKHPEDWKSMEGNWDKLFPGIELDVEIDVSLRSTGGLIKPITPGGAA